MNLPDMSAGNKNRKVGRKLKNTYVSAHRHAGAWYISVPGHSYPTQPAHLRDWAHWILKHTEER